MKQIFSVLVTALIIVSTTSCTMHVAQTPEELPEGLTWERLLYKNDLKQFKRVAFSSDGEQFLISDDYRFISLWARSFIAPSRVISLKLGMESIVEMKFFGDQNDVFLANDNGVVQVWDRDLQIKKFENQIDGNTGMAAITGDGRYVATDDELYDRKKKSLVGRAVAHASHTALCFGGHSQLLTAGYHDHRIAIRNMDNGKFEYRTTPYPVSSAGISPNEKYAVAVTKKGRCYLWYWPDQESKVLAITRESSYFGGFSPDSKWFVIRGSEFLHIFQTDPAVRIARLQPDPAITSVHIASNNLIVMGDRNGYVNIYDISAGTMIARQKVIEHAAGSIELIADESYLWAASSYYDLKKNDHGEIALYRISGLEPYIEPQGAAKFK